MNTMIIAGQSLIPESVKAEVTDYSNLTVNERAQIWARSVNQSKQTALDMLGSCHSFPEVSQLLVATLGGIELKEDRESFRGTVNKTLERVRERCAGAVLKFRTNPEQFPGCETEQDVVAKFADLPWFTDTLTLSWGVASLTNLSVKAGTHKKGSCIPALPAPVESATVAESTPAPAKPATVAESTPAPAKPAPFIDEWDGLPRERVIKRAVQYRKQAYELQGIVASQGEALLKRDNEIRDLLARIAELEKAQAPKRGRKTGTDK